MDDQQRIAHSLPAGYTLHAVTASGPPARLRLHGIFMDATMPYPLPAGSIDLIRYPSETAAQQAFVAAQTHLAHHPAQTVAIGDAGMLLTPQPTPPMFGDTTSLWFRRGCVLVTLMTGTSPLTATFQHRMDVPTLQQMAMALDHLLATEDPAGDWPLGDGALGTGSSLE